MAGIYGLSREAVRVKVKKCERNLAPEWRKFSVDPQITSLEVLYSILAKAFDLKCDFSISYKAVDPNDQEVLLPVLSDWDLDAAFLRAYNHSIVTGTDPCLCLQVDIKPFSEATDWDQSNTTTTTTTSTKDMTSITPQSINNNRQKYVQTMQNRLPGLIMNHMEKTFTMVTRALNFVEEQAILPSRQPLSDAEFRSFLDSVGQIVQPNTLRKVVYSGGIDPSLRRVVWRHILNVYPDGMTGRQRMDYMKRKATEYHRLRDVWRAVFHSGPVSGELAYVTSMVQKDVLRTDRLHPFYAGNDDNQNITSLFNILTTYALNHSVSYCQGMSDIASPLLVTMCDEAQAYICFCAVMKRLNINFMLDGIAMTQKFAHLSEALQFYDPEFYDYLKMHQADDLLFCYRWLLLEMKREFAFDDSLRMLEVLWSSLPPEPPTDELNLFEKEFVPPTNEPQLLPKCTVPSVTMRKPRETAYTKLCEMRRQSSSQSLIATSPSAIHSAESINLKGLDATKRLNHSLDENITRNQLPSGRNNLSKNFQSLDESKINIVHQQKISCSIDLNDGLLEQMNNEKNNEKNQQDQQSEEVVTNNTSENTITNHERHEEAPIANNNVIVNSERFINVGGGHFKDLKEHLVAGKKEIFASLDKIDKTSCTDEVDGENSMPKGGKIVRNFNEFLNLASKGAKITLNRSNSVTTTESRNRTAGVRHTRSSHQNLDSSKSFESESISDHIYEAQKKINKKALQLQLEDKRQLSLDGSSPDDSQEYFPMTTSITRELRLELDNLNRQVFGNSFSPKTIRTTKTAQTQDTTPESGDSHISNNRSPRNFTSDISYKKINQNSEDETHLDKIYTMPTDVDEITIPKVNEQNKRASAISTNNDVFVWENPLHHLIFPTTTDLQQQQQQQQSTHYLTKSKNPFFSNDFLHALTPDEQNELEYDGEIFDESTDGKKSITPIRLLRKGGDSENKAISGGSNSKRNSNIFRNDSNSSCDVSETEVNLIMKTSAFSETNPFLVDIAASLGAEEAISVNVTENGTNDIEKPFIDEEASEAETDTNVVLNRLNNISLPAPLEFGGGNPFLIFLCLTLLLQHRNYVMKNQMDYNEMAMHFDKMVRKHNVIRVLNQARKMYADYLKSQNMSKKTECERNNAASMASIKHDPNQNGDFTNGTYSNDPLAEAKLNLHIFGAWKNDTRNSFQFYDKYENLVYKPLAILPKH